MHEQPNVRSPSRKGLNAAGKRASVCIDGAAGLRRRRSITASICLRRSGVCFATQPVEGQQRGSGQPRRQSASRRRGQKVDFFSPDSWKDVGTNKMVIQAVSELGFTRPSHVQAEAMRALLSGAIRLVIIIPSQYTVFLSQSTETDNIMSKICPAHMFFASHHLFFSARRPCSTLCRREARSSS
jgi:hypothetical protein